MFSFEQELFANIIFEYETNSWSLKCKETTLKLLIFCGQLVAIRSIKEAKSLTILAGLAISCLKLILLNKDLSCSLSGLLHLDDIKHQLKSPVRIVSFPWTAAQAKIMSSLVINWLS